MPDANLSLDWQGALDAFRADAEPIVLDALRDEAPARSGGLRDSIRIEATADGLRAVTDKGYAKAVIGGTRAHEIVPNAKQALFWEGAEHPVRGVQHPGTQPNDFPERAKEAIKANTDLLARLRAGIKANLKLSFDGGQ